MKRSLKAALALTMSVASVLPQTMTVAVSAAETTVNTADTTVTARTVETRTNLALNATVVSSSYGDPTYALDGSMTSCWDGGDAVKNGPASAVIDLGDIYSVDHIKVFTYYMAYDGRGYSYELYASQTNGDEDDSWVKVAEKTDPNIEATSDGDDYQFDAVNARYFKVIMLAQGNSGPKISNDSVHLNELQIYGERTQEFKYTTNVALNKTVTATSGATNVAKLVDGNYNQDANSFDANLVGSNAKESYFLIDLEEDYLVDHIIVYPLYYGHYWRNRGYKYEVQISQDGVNFTTIGDHGYTDASTLKVSTGTGDLYVLDSVQTIRYVRINMNGNSDNDGNHLSEVEVFGTPTTAQLTNVLQGLDSKNITASATHGGWVGSLTVDGDYTTWWDGDDITLKPTITYDLGEVYKLDRIRVAPYYDGVRAYEFNVYTSLDGNEWTKVGSWNEGASQGLADYKMTTMKGEVFKTDGLEARYIQVEGIGTTSSSGSFHLIETEAYELERLSDEDFAKLTAEYNGAKALETTGNSAFDTPVSEIISTYETLVKDLNNKNPYVVDAEQPSDAIAQAKADLKSALEDVLAEVTADTAGYTSASVKKLSDAVSAAKADLASEDATGADYITDALAVSDAEKNLVKLGDKTELQAAYAAYQAESLSGYTADSVQAYEKAAADAKAVLDDNQADEADVADALDALTKAHKALTVDLSSLEAALAKTPEKEDSAYTPASLAAYKEAAAAAEKVLADGAGAATVDEVASVTAKLTAAYDALALRADNSALKSELEKANALDQDTLTASSAAALQSAIDAADKVAENGDATEEEIANALSALQQAEANAVVKGKKSDLQKALDALGTYDASAYTEASYKVLTEAKDAVNTLLEKDENELTQDEVTKAVAALDAAVEGLKPAGSADYTEVDKAKADFEAKKATGLYTEESLAKVQEAIDAVDENLYVSQQDTVDGYAKAINAAIAALEKRDANYDAVNAAVEKAKAISADDVKDYSKVQEALDAVVSGKKIDEQETVDGYADAINSAIEALEYKDADYSKVNAAKDKASALNRDQYTEESLKAVDDAVAAVVEGKDVREQEAVDAYATAIEDALGKLDLVKADYTKVDEAIAKAKAINADQVKDYSKVQAALDAVVTDKKVDEQDAVDAYAKAINDAIDAIEYKDADYSKVDAAKEKASALDRSLYTADSLKAVDDTVAAVETGKDIREQETVDGYAAAIEAALGKLEKLEANYDAVNAAIVKAKAINADQVKDYSQVQEALDAVITGKKIDEQADVDAYAKAINDAVDAVEYKDADYTKVDAAIAAAKAVDRTLYTEDSLKVLDDAVDAVISGKDIREQDAVDGYADVINAAIKNLVYAPADYSEVKAAVNKAQALKSGDYVDFSAVTAAVNAVDYTKDKSEQDAVDAYAKAINDAIDALEKKVQTAPVENAVEFASSLDLSAFADGDAKDAVSEKAAAAKEAAEKAESQEAVDAAGKALNQALMELRVEPSQTALDQVLALLEELKK
jgi:hypothetical protein